jgi:hypothetical protein
LNLSKAKGKKYGGRQIFIHTNFEDTYKIPLLITRVRFESYLNVTHKTVSSS